MLRGDGDWVFGAISGYLLHSLHELKSAVDKLERRATVREKLPAMVDAIPAAKSRNAFAAAASQTSAEPAAEPASEPASEPVSVAEPVEPPMSQSDESVTSSAEMPLEDELESEPNELDATLTFGGGDDTAMLEAEARQSFARMAAHDKPEPDPSWFDSLLQLVDRHLGSRNPLVLVGAVVMLFGVGFLLNYAVQEGWLVVSIAGRHALVALAAVAAIAFGVRLEGSRRYFAIGIQGAGYGALYLTVFSAMRYLILARPVAFLLFVALSGLTGARAHRSSALPLALLAITGGFLAPVLTSNGGNHVAFFSYLLILDVGVLLLSWFRAWRVLNVVSFGATLLLGVGWGSTRYTPELFWSVEPFLIALFLLFVAVPVLFANHRPRANDRFDAFLFFVNPGVFLLLQHELLKSIDGQFGWNPVALAIGYAGLSRLLKLQQAPCVELERGTRFLAFVFGAHAVPLFFSHQVTSAVWAAIGLVMVTYGAEKNRLSFRVAGILLQLAGGAAMLLGPPRSPEDLPFLNSTSIGMAVLAISGLVGSRFSDRQRILETNRLPAQILFGLGTVWWFAWILLECKVHAAPLAQVHFQLAVVAVSVVLAECFSALANWKRLRCWSLALLPSAFLAAAVRALLLPGRSPMEDFGIAVWPFVLVLLGLDLYRKDDKSFSIIYHGGLYFLLQLLCSMELEYWMNRMVVGHDFVLVSRAVVPAIGLWIVSLLSKARKWPVASHRSEYLGVFAACNAVFIVFWIIATAPIGGSIQNYFFLHLLDVASIALLLSIGVWIRQLLFWKVINPNPANRTMIRRLGLAVLVLVVNVLAARAVHHVIGLPYRFSTLWTSAVYQTTLTILWGMLGVSLILLATMRSQRTVWLTGAAVLGAVVAKLFLVDLSHTGSGSQVISFVGLGALLIAVGYFAPLPPVDRLTEP